MGAKLKKFGAAMTVAEQQRRAEQTAVMAQVFYAGFAMNHPLKSTRDTTWDGLHPDIRKAIIFGVAAVLERIEAGDG